MMFMSHDKRAEGYMRRVWFTLRREWEDNERSSRRGLPFPLEPLRPRDNVIGSLLARALANNTSISLSNFTSRFFHVDRRPDGSASRTTDGRELELADPSHR